MAPVSVSPTPLRWRARRLAAAFVFLAACAPPPGLPSSDDVGARPALDPVIEADLQRMADQFLSVQSMDPFVHDLGLDLDQAEAYRWQRAFLGSLQATLGGVAGYKTGGHDTAPPNPNFPPGGIRATLLDGMIHPSGTAVALHEVVWGFLEADFAFRVGDRSINSAETDLEILAGLDAVVPLVEIPDPAFVGNARSPTGSIVTNMASRFAFVGDPVPIGASPDWLERLNNMTFAVHDEAGTEVGAGTLDGHYVPLEIVRWIRDHVRDEGLALEPGHLLSLGNIGISRQLKPDSPAGAPAYTGSLFRLSYYGLSDEPAVVEVVVER